MTSNQIAYWNAVENQRHNLANETLDEYKFERNLEHEREMQSAKAAVDLQKESIKSRSLFGKLQGQALALGYLGQESGRASRRGESTAGTLNQIHLYQPSWNPSVTNLGNVAGYQSTGGRRGSSSTNSQTISSGGRYYE